jgi:hypothetical protein
MSAKKGNVGEISDIDVSARHVANMSPTFPTKLLKLLRCSHLLYTSTGIICFFLFEIFTDANIVPAVTLFIVEGEHIINFTKFILDGMNFSAVDCHVIIDLVQMIKRQGASWFEMPL